MEDETSEGKLAIGIGVLVVTAAVVIVCPAVLGAAAATVTQSIATSAIIGAATSGVMNGIASMKSGKSFYDGFANGFESGAILGAISGGLGAGTSAIMSGAELTVGRVMAVKAMNMVSDATVDTVVYAYHSNKYDKDFTGGDIVKTWVKSAATSFAMQSVGGGKSSSKAESENGVISTGKGQGGGGGNVNWKNGKKTVDVNGKTVTMDKNTFDPGFVDKQGRTNTQRMEQGLAPIGTDGKSVNIHHIDQTDNGPVMEITATEHQQNYSKLHTNIGQAPSKINRSKFNKWRREYWKWRSNNLD